MPALRFVPDRASTTAYLLLLVSAVAIAAGCISLRELPLSPLSAICTSLGLLFTAWLGLNYADHLRASGSVRRVVAIMLLILGAIGCVSGIAKQDTSLFAYGSSGLIIAWLLQFATAAGEWTLLGLGTAVLLPAVQISSPDISQRLAASAVRFASWSLDDWNVIHQSTSDYLRLGSLEWDWRTSLARAPFTLIHFLTVSVFVSLIRHRGALVSTLSAVVSVGFSWLSMIAFVLIVAYGESTWHRNLATGMDTTVVQSALWISAILCFIIAEWFIAACAAPVPPPGSESDFVFATCNLLLHWPQLDPTAELEHDDDHPASASSTSHSLKAAVSQQHRDDEEMTLRGMWLASLSRPSLLTQGAAELAIGWLFTRRLLPILTGAGLFALCGLFIASGVRGRSLTETQLIKRYSDHLKSKVTNAGAASDQQSTTASTAVAGDTEQNLIQARLFELGDDTPATIYAAALGKSESGRTDEARELFRKIAPGVKQGYPPAHAWLAADMLAAQSRSSSPWSRDQLRELLWHLSYGTDAPQAGPGLKAAYAQLLEQQGSKEQAIAQMRAAAGMDHDLTVPLAAMAARCNMPEVVREARLRAIEVSREAIDSDRADAKCYAQLAALALLEGQADESLQLSQTGLQKHPGQADLKRLASEALRKKFRDSVRKVDSGWNLNLDLLDSALKADPSNPAIGEDIAAVMSAGIATSDALKEELQRRLANGQATAVTHLIVANTYLARNELNKAVPHLESALQQAPGSPVILNNLALSLARTDATQMARAEELIEQGIRVGGVSAYSAELFDTQGEILLLARKPTAAIAALENAVGLNRARTSTRKLLVQAYKQAGMADMAVVQERIIKDLEQKTEQPTSK